MECDHRAAPRLMFAEDHDFSWASEPIAGIGLNPRG